MKKQLSLLLLFPILSFANENTNIESFFEDISQVTTQSKINIDHQPSALTVLYGDDLKALGIRTLSEALDFVPGIEASTTNSAAHHLIIRGASQPYSPVYEKVKYTIDGVDIGFYYLSNFPIELVDRIEIVRGGATAEYGQHALQGAVNIITKTSNKNDKNHLFVEGGSFNSKKAIATVQEKINNFNVGFDVYYQTHDRKVDAPNAKDTTVSVIPQTFPREKESLEGIKEKGFALNISKGDFEFHSRYTYLNNQNYYGFFGLLDHNEEGYSKYKMFNNKLSYKKDLQKDLSINADVGLSKVEYDLNTYLYLLEPNLFGFKNPHYQKQYTIEKPFLDISLNTKQIENHNLELGIYLAKFKTTENNFLTNADASAAIGMEFPTGSGDYYPISSNLTTLSGANGFLNVPGDQSIYSYYLNDLYSYSDNLTFSFDIRMDNYQYFDEALSSKVASVYSNDNKNIYKLILSSATQVPSQIQSYTVNHLGVQGNPNLKSEKINSIELAYIYKNMGEVFKLNSFYSEHKNSIDITMAGTYSYNNNPHKQYSHGIELEYSKLFENRSKLMINASYSKYNYSNQLFATIPSTINETSPNASQVIAHLGYIYPISANLTWGNLLKYYGKKETVTDATIKDAILVDTSIQYKINKDLELSLTGKNIFNTKYYYGTNQTDSELMQREGRTLFLGLQYTF